MKQVGFCANRLEEDPSQPGSKNPREVTFAELWDEMNKVGHGGQPSFVERMIPNCTDRDIQVAATIIQWLGTNVGIDMIREAAERNPKIMEWITGGER